MKVSLNWLQELLGTRLDPDVVARRLTMSGTEVEEVTRAGALDEGIVVARVEEVAAHPSVPSLKVVKVHDGRGTLQVVCGAPNTPGGGARVVLARAGATVQGQELSRRELRGVVSEGMLVSELELGIGPDGSGIMILGDGAAPGTAAAEALGAGDWILDLGVTPNRPDLLGHLGVAREVAVLLGIPFAEPGGPLPPDASDESAGDAVRVSIGDPAGCPRYAAALVRGITIAPSPPAVRMRLHALGVRPINNAVDTTNWVLLLYNQPLHAFDLRRIAGGRIEARRARPGERIVTLDGTDRALDPRDMVIADGSGPVAVAGVMGGLGSEVEPDTRDVFIESAYFNPVDIRATSARLRLSSESSYRFERGIDPEGQATAARAAAAMMCRLGGGRAARGVADVHPSPRPRATTRLRGARIGRIVGARFGWDEELALLGRLGCEVRRAEGGAEEAEVTAPPFRPDLTREIDLIEEVARLRGYDAIPSTGPRIAVAPPQRGSHDLLRRARVEAAAAGFTEVVNISIVGAARQRRLVPASGDGAVRLANPLPGGRDEMRVSLLPGLIDNLLHAISWREKSVRIFEAGTAFRRGEGGIVPGIVEEKRIAALAWGARPGWIGEQRGEADAYDALGLIGHLSERLWGGGAAVERARESEAAALPFLFPLSACVVAIDGKPAGWAGELHPALAQELDLPPGSAGVAKVGVFELSLPLGRRAPKKFRHLPLFPSVDRDIAMLFDAAVPAGAVVGTVREIGGELLESVSIFDVYTGKGVEAGKKSLALSLVFRSAQETLRAEEVDRIRERIVAELEKRLGGKLR